MAFSESANFPNVSVFPIFHDFLLKRQLIRFNVFKLDLVNVKILVLREN